MDLKSHWTRPRLTTRDERGGGGLLTSGPARDMTSHWTRPCRGGGGELPQGQRVNAEYLRQGRGGGGGVYLWGGKGR